LGELWFPGGLEGFKIRVLKKGGRDYISWSTMPEMLIWKYILLDGGKRFEMGDGAFF